MTKSSGTATYDEVVLKLRDFIKNEIMFEQNNDLDESVPLLELGILDSLAMVTTISFIKEQFGISVPEDRILPENFQDLKHLAQLVVTLSAESGVAKKVG